MNETVIEVTEELEDAAATVSGWLLADGTDELPTEIRSAIWALVNAVEHAEEA